MRAVAAARGVAAALAVACSVAASPAAADIPEGAGPGAAAGADAIELVNAERLTPRLQELTLSTPAVAGQTRVRVLLPAGYDSHSGRYPVLYLLHGAWGSYRSYTEETGVVEELTERLEVIVVMPDSGATAGYQDWWNGGELGPPAWETYHVAQLVPWIDERYRTVGKRRGRAVAGLSMGGNGAIGYTARHPDLFAHAAGFSPAVDGTHPSIVLVNETPLVNGGLAQSPAAGPYATQEVRWRGNNPVDLAENLRGVGVALRTGDGRPGGEFGGGPDYVEEVCFEGSLKLHGLLEEHGIDHVWDYYGAGAHTWPYWERDLRLEIPRIMDTFAEPPRRPRRFAYRSINDAYDVWGWEVEVDRAALEFSRLAVAGRRRFTLSGSGEAVVRTPPRFAPGSRHQLELFGAFGSERVVGRADPAGRIEVRVPLGPANAEQQYTDAAAEAGSRFYETRVAVR